MNRLIKQSKSKGKKSITYQCSLGRSSQCQNITLYEIFQTCTNETSIVFTPLKAKINMFNLEERYPFDCVTSKGVEIMQKQQFHTFLKLFSEIFMLWDNLFFFRFFGSICHMLPDFVSFSMNYLFISLVYVSIKLSGFIY